MILPSDLRLAREFGRGTLVADFTVPGPPVSKQRPRTDTRGLRPRTYTPKKTTDAEEAVGWAYRGVAHGPVDATSRFGLALIFSVDQLTRDTDNMVKLVMDGLNHVAYADDRQVDEVSARKVKCPKASQRTRVVLYRL